MTSALNTTTRPLATQSTTQSTTPHITKMKILPVDTPMHNATAQRNARDMAMLISVLATRRSTPLWERHITHIIMSICGMYVCKGKLLEMQGYGDMDEAFIRRHANRVDMYLSMPDIGLPPYDIHSQQDALVFASTSLRNTDTSRAHGSMA